MATNKIADFESVLPKLKKIQIFTDFAEDTPENHRILKAVYENMSVQHFKAGQIIIKEGDFGETFYILHEGKVQVTRDTLAGDTLALADLSADMNIFFGETALISDDARTATVRAVTDCTTITLDSKKFLEVCDAEPILGYRVILRLARRMAKTIRDSNSDKTILYEALFNEVEGGM
jgi:CRP-like cAMP-binding protein